MLEDKCIYPLERESIKKAWYNPLSNKHLVIKTDCKDC